jgi:hypothetical protein
MASTGLPFAQAPPIGIACEPEELGNNQRRDVRVVCADQVDRPNSDRDRKSAGFNERDERPETAHPRHTMGVALIAERAVVRPGDSPGIARYDHADLVRERERRVGNGSFSELVQRRLDDLQAECRALQVVKAVDLCENRRGDDDPCQVLSDEPQDGLVRIRDVDEHTGVTDERGPRCSLHRLRPGLVKVAHLPEVETEDLGRATE